MGKLDPIGVVCEMFDVDVLYDIMEPGEGKHAAGCPKSDGEECTCRPVQVMALGGRQELSAGLRGFVMSPYFQNEADLRDWCKRNFDRLLEFSKRDEIPPDSDTWV